MTATTLWKCRIVATMCAVVLHAGAVSAEPWVGPGDIRLRNDLQLLNDRGIINIPLTAWPVAWGDVHQSLERADVDALDSESGRVLRRVRSQLRQEMRVDRFDFKYAAGGSSEPRVIRTFENTPREDGEARAALSWVGRRFAINLDATYAHNPLDGDEFRLDGTYVGMALGNWMFSAGWQERWWGPGRDGSLILSTNARPAPGIGLQRIASRAPKWKWLKWVGPWTLTTFMEELDDDRVIEDAWLWGFRTSFKPVNGLEIGLSRTAQWCGDGRICDFKTFLRLLNGNDNSGANVNAEDEPGNQLGGIDMRWSLPKQIPVALYMQWIAEDTRRTGAQLHLWMQQAGIEYWGSVGGWTHRTHFEYVDTNSHKGALGEGSAVPNVAYNHGIFRTGYRFLSKSIGHSMDNDGRSLSVGSTVVDSSGHTWNFTVRQMEINRNGQRDLRNTLSATPQDRIDVQLSHDRLTRYGRIYIGVAYSTIDDQLTDTESSDFGGFLRWSSQ